MADQIDFKFQMLNARTRKERKIMRGSFNGEQIVLGPTTIPIFAVNRAVARFNSMVISVAQRGGTSANVLLTIRSANREQLVQKINQIASVMQATRRKEALDDAGRGDLFRTEICPHCQAMVDLSGFAETPQFHCAFCDAIVTPAEPIPGEQFYHKCGKCLLYSRPQVFTIFYFYFLVFIYGYRSRHVFMCRPCLRKEAWKMVVGNAPFVLGFPFAVIRLAQAYRDGTKPGAAFSGLNRANALVSAVKYKKAAQHYERMEAADPQVAGIWFNHGTALLRDGKTAEAAGVFGHALAVCANYPDAFQGLAECYRTMRADQELASLAAQWNVAGRAIQDAAVARAVAAQADVSGQDAGSAEDTAAPALPAANGS